jgi:hypothetical protein
LVANLDHDAVAGLGRDGIGNSNCRTVVYLVTLGGGRNLGTADFLVYEGTVDVVAVAGSMAVCNVGMDAQKAGQAGGSILGANYHLPVVGSGKGDRVGQPIRYPAAKANICRVGGRSFRDSLGCNGAGAASPSFWPVRAEAVSLQLPLKVETAEEMVAFWK